jgi:hypothetical protein
MSNNLNYGYNGTARSARSLCLLGAADDDKGKFKKRPFNFRHKTAVPQHIEALLRLRLLAGSDYQ